MGLRPCLSASGPMTTEPAPPMTIMQPVRMTELESWNP